MNHCRAEGGRTWEQLLFKARACLRCARGPELQHRMDGGTGRVERGREGEREGEKEGGRRSAGATFGWIRGIDSSGTLLFYTLSSQIIV